MYLFLSIGQLYYILLYFHLQISIQLEEMEAPLRKEFKDAHETSESFNVKKQPLQERRSDNLPFVTQIQDLMSILVRKKNQLRQLKLSQANIKGKGQEQEKRIEDMKIQMDHQIQKEEINRAQIMKNQDEATASKQAIIQLSNQIKQLKNQIIGVFQQIKACKKQSDKLNMSCNSIQRAINNKKIENDNIDQQIQNLEALLNATENDNRNKQDQLTQQKIQEAELISLLSFLQEKAKSARNHRHKTSNDNKDLDKQITRAQNKNHNLNKQINDINWKCEQLITQNHRIQDLNCKLYEDLSGVQEHLAMMQKTQRMLENALREYGSTGDKVTRIIVGAKCP